MKSYLTVTSAMNLCQGYTQHHQLSSMAVDSIQQEGKMAIKEIGKGKWFTYGRMSGFGIGFSINRYFIDVQLGFWYIGFEF